MRSQHLPMKTKANMENSFNRLTLLGLSLAELALAGCASRGYDKSQAAAVSLHSAAAQVQGQSRALELTLGTLNDLVNKPPADLKGQFQLFSSNLDQLSAAARRNDRAADEMARRSAEYFETWDKQLVNMNYEAIRTRSQARRTEVANQFESVNRHYHEAQAALGPLVDYLYDIRKALGADLTVGGLESIKEIVNNANARADSRAR